MHSIPLYSIKSKQLHYKPPQCERGCSPMRGTTPAPRSKDAEVDACHIGLITDPDCLGPCDPGTSVTLEGIVWNETENGEGGGLGVISTILFIINYVPYFRELI